MCPLPAQLPRARQGQWVPQVPWVPRWGGTLSSFLRLLHSPLAMLAALAWAGEAEVLRVSSGMGQGWDGIGMRTGAEG